MTGAIFGETGKVTEGLYHVDLNQYGMKRLCSAFVLKTSKCLLILDTGTSDDVRALVRFIKRNGWDPANITFIVPTHFHFDHFGGGWKLWKKIMKFNPSVKILTTRETMEHLQDASLHLKRARRTFGDFVGEMIPLPENAYEIVETDTPLDIPGLEDGESFSLVSTPGHVPDHVCPTMNRNGENVFCFTGEAAGTLFHSRKLVTFGTSMPPDFTFKEYMESLEKIIALEPTNAGYCHFGTVMGKENVTKVLEENRQFSIFFKDYVKREFEKSGSVRTVVEKFAAEEAPGRTDLPRADLLVNILVALVYGQLVDLGLKQPK
ncbi:MBL fold metallo-hydrolase [Candidatus Bathyarchaeota archaeon]|nr:MBL fold metallo-hydrolase [Candidatus Bathyarchaeota archaeon]